MNTSNKLADTWAANNRIKKLNDRDYIKMINPSPWCYYKPVRGGGHNEVRHISIKDIEFNHGKLYDKRLVIHKDGQEQWIRNNWNIVLNACGAPESLGVPSVVIDGKYVSVEDGRLRIR